MVLTGNGLFILQEELADGSQHSHAPLPLDAFVTLVDSLGPQKVRRITKNDAAFERQLVKRS
jgi:hypothetical protein